MPVVLVVDDESQIRELLVRWISSSDYPVREAATAVAALEEMESAPAGVVLCDVHMPGENGLWLTEQLRTRFPETAIVLATSDRNVPAHVSMQPGVVEYLGKPFTREEVVEAVRLAAAWHATAVSRRGSAAAVEPLPKTWIPVTKS